MSGDIRLDNNKHDVKITSNQHEIINDLKFIKININFEKFRM